MSDDLTKSAVFTQIREFIKKLTMEYNTDYRVAFLTPIGKIVCDLEPFAEKSSLIGITDDPTVFTVDISALFSNDNIGTHVINATNVVVYKNDSGKEIMRTNQMILFADQIIGITIVNKDK